MELREIRNDKNYVEVLSTKERVAFINAQYVEGDSFDLGNLIVFNAKTEEEFLDSAYCEDVIPQCYYSLIKANFRHAVETEMKRKQLMNIIDGSNPAQGIEMSQVEEIVTFKVTQENALLQKAFSEQAKKLRDITKKLEALRDAQEKHTITILDQERTIAGILHEKFDEVLSLISLNIPVYLVGDAGTGKSKIVEQAAESLGLDFYSEMALQDPFKLSGYTDANSHFTETEFYKAFKYGGVFMIDEIDGSAPEILIQINTAIANGYYVFGNKEKVFANEKFRICVAGNTYGNGADLKYTGRYKLDAATLDRFCFVEVDYSSKIENAMTNGNEELIDFCHGYRKAAKQCGIDTLFSYRALSMITKMLTCSAFEDLSKVLKMTVTKNLETDDIHILSNQIEDNELVYNCSENKFFKALTKLGVNE